MLLPLRRTTSAIIRPEWYIYETLFVLSSTPLFFRISSKKVGMGVTHSAAELAASSSLLLLHGPDWVGQCSTIGVLVLALV